VLLLAVGAAWAQEGPGPVELRKMYDDVVSQLKSAQDRKNELSGENDRLTKKLAEVEKRAKSLENRNAELERDALEYAEKTYEHRAVAAAWRVFVGKNADVRTRWNKYLEGAAAGEDEQTWYDRAWPFREG